MQNNGCVDLHFRVRYAESDQGGFAYHANYLIWFEMGRSELCRTRGYPYSKIEENGLLLVVAEANCRYKRPARYDDPLIVRTSLTHSTRKVFKFSYQIIHAETGELKAEGETTHVVVSSDTGRPTSLPDHVLKALQA